MNYLSLKSGSDVRGVAIGEDATLTPEVAKTLGTAFVGLLAQKTGLPPQQLKVALGRDSRVSGPYAACRRRGGHCRRGCNRAGLRHVHHAVHVYGHFNGGLLRPTAPL